jgi:putative transposase
VVPARQRQQIAPTDDWEQLQLLTAFPEQRTYELIRPIVLFGQSPSERARQTATPHRTLSRQAAQFEATGMASLFVTTPSTTQSRLAPEIREAILALAAEYSAFRPNELATICQVRFGHRPSHRTIRRVLATAMLPVVARRFPPYHEIPDAAERRLAIIRLHSEGWNKQSIAGYLQTSRETVHTTLRRWIVEGVAGLDDKPRGPHPGSRKVDLQAMRTVRELQENPELGEFRIHAALKQLGIELSPRTCGRILAVNRRLYGLGKPVTAKADPKLMPFKARRRHQFWTVDIRYLDHGVDDDAVYCISILETYSRAILASGISRKQDLTAYLIVLYAAIQQHGAPEALVSDGGGVFRAKQALQVYERLGITKLQIERRQPWQSSIETQFNVQRRMADWHFAQATTWTELLAAHDRWVVDFNFQVHWAHREREDGRQSPAEVLGWVLGRVTTPEELRRVFYATRFDRIVNRLGYVRFRHWRIYAERGAAHEAVAIWLYREQLTVAMADEPLAQYQVTYQPDQRHLASMAHGRLFATPYRSPQPPLWEWGADDWLMVLRAPPYHPRRQRRVDPGWQQALPLDALTQEHALA